MYYVSGDRYKRGLLLAKEQQVPAQNSNNLTGRERALENTRSGIKESAAHAKRLLSLCTVCSPCMVYSSWRLLEFLEECLERGGKRGEGCER